MQMYESIGLVIGQVLGGKSESSPPPSEAPAQNANDLAARLGRVLG